MEELAKRVEKYLPADFPKAKLMTILPLISERLVKLSEMETLTEFFYRPISHDPALLIKKTTQAEAQAQLQVVIGSLQAIPDWTIAALETVLRGLAVEHEWKNSQFFMLIRVAVTGRMATPPLFETMAIIGQTEVINRLTAALKTLQT